ncbi:MAG: hypothetical protein HQK55_06945, partial [Deltaproteobacteria bacterium]|nr:hypothetical protein [Deltaproteobacteria bacterium]
TLAEIDKLRLKSAQPDHDLMKRKAVRASADIHAMMISLQAIADGRYQNLTEAFERITSELTTCCQLDFDKSQPLVIDLRDIKTGSADLVGGKIANLAELANTLKLPTPSGFAVTTEAYRVFLKDGGLHSWLQTCLLEMASSSDTGEWVETIRSEFKETSLPQQLETAIMEAYTRRRDQSGPDLTLAVRSSAVGEDSRLSFAGQYLTVLNVGPEKLFDSYKEVISSLFSPEAIHYRSLHGVPNEGVEMAVAFITQIDALAGGVIFTVNPSQPESGKVIIQAVRGLGVSLVEGRVSPETISVMPDEEFPRLELIPSGQDKKIICSKEGDLREENIDPVEAATPILTEEEARILAAWAKKIEAHFGEPQDIEWVMGQDRRLYLLQSRPLKLAKGADQRFPPLDGWTLLLSGGEVACPGVGAGPAVHLTEDDDLESFPRGGVLVTHRPSPKFIRLMDKTSAIVTDFGSTTGHMASLARELKVPALLNTKIATKTIPPGALVTIDSTNGYVYAGEVPELLAQAEVLEPADADSEKGLKERPLSQILDLIIPLNLTDPRSPDFNLDQARTLHDLARYIHEKSYELMFGLGDKLGDMRPSSYLLDVFLPIDLYIIDLGGGFKEPLKDRKVKRNQISSVPMSAVLEGMMDRRLSRFGPKPIDMRGLFSIMMRHATENPTQEQTFKDPSYALISSNYLNLTARVGYHFSVVDTYCGITP